MTVAFSNSRPMPMLFQQRILSLTFPHLPADRMARIRWGASWLSKGRPDHPPVVFAGQVKNAMRIVALDRLAEKSGFRHDQGVAEARAMCPSIDVIASDPVADSTFLCGLADWCDRYTPLVALDGDNGLFLDITGCVHLHGGEKSLLDDLLSRLFHLGIEARGAIASSAGLSWAVARFGEAGIVVADDAQSVLSPLPVRALRLGVETVAALDRVGLKRIGDLLHLPRAPLARRFGPGLLLRLDQALGLEEEPLSPRLPVPDLSAERRLPTPVQGEEDILGLVLHLAKGLKSDLEARCEGGRLFELLLFRVDGKVFRLQAATSAPLRDPERISKLYQDRLQAVHDDLDAGFGFEILRLSILKTEAFTMLQADFSGTPDQAGSLSTFTDRVIARLGPESLSVPMFVESHVPERAVSLAPLQDAAALKDAAPGGIERRFPSGARKATRPLRLLAHPEPVDAIAAEVPEGAPQRFSWRRTIYRVTRAEGPERIAPEWWRDGEDAPTRDYFRVEDEEGYRFWLFRNGLYHQSPAPPRWFLHGFFA